MESGLPYRLIVPSVPMLDAALVEAVANELREKTPVDADDASSDAPYITEEQIRRSNRIHVTLLWDRWAAVGPEERSHIILEAYRDVRGPSALLTLTSALGLTHAEAKRLGVEDGVLYAA